MQNESRLKKDLTQPAARIAKDHFAPENYDEVKRLIAESATAHGPAIQALKGLLYYHVGLDANAKTIINVSLWGRNKLPDRWTRSRRC